MVLYDFCFFKDIDECAISGCFNGTCVDKVNGFICHCYPGFTGQLCEIGKYLMEICHNCHRKYCFATFKYRF